MLDAAGVRHEAIAPTIDEAALKKDLDGPEETALELAKAKACNVSRERPDDWVIGSDSVVSVEGRLFDKPANRDEAVEHLRFFSGKAVQLVSAVAIARHAGIEWSHAEIAQLHVRPLSETFIEAYLDQEWPQVAYCVGVFRLEARGVQLFERIDGNHFTILGMPLLHLLGALRERGVIAS